jgi:hypothetical protein
MPGEDSRGTWENATRELQHSLHGEETTKAENFLERRM